MPREFSRNQRMGAQIKRILSELIRFDTKDPRLANVSLTVVELTRDLSVAKVYFSLLHPDEDPKPALEGLERASGFLRGRLGNKLTVRHVPELRFVHDDSVAHGVEISRLIESAANPDSSG